MDDMNHNMKKLCEDLCLNLRSEIYDALATLKLEVYKDLQIISSRIDNMQNEICNLSSSQKKEKESAYKRRKLVSNKDLTSDGKSQTGNVAFSVNLDANSKSEDVKSKITEMCFDANVGAYGKMGFDANVGASGNLGSYSKFFSKSGSGSKFSSNSKVNVGAFGNLGSGSKSESGSIFSSKSEDAKFKVNEMGSDENDFGNLGSGSKSEDAKSKVIEMGSIEMGSDGAFEKFSKCKDAKSRGIHMGGSCVNLGGFGKLDTGFGSKFKDVKVVKSAILRKSSVKSAKAKGLKIGKTGNAGHLRSAEEVLRLLGNSKARNLKIPEIRDEFLRSVEGLFRDEVEIGAPALYHYIQKNKEDFPLLWTQNKPQILKKYSYAKDSSWFDENDRKVYDAGTVILVEISSGSEDDGNDDDQQQKTKGKEQIMEDDDVVVIHKQEKRDFERTVLLSKEVNMADDDAGPSGTLQEEQNSGAQEQNSDLYQNLIFVDDAEKRDFEAALLLSLQEDPVSHV